MIFRSDERGFTLFELLAVLFILAIASSIVGVAVGRSFEAAKLREEASRLQNSFRYAREMSLMERIPVTFVVDTEEGAYWIEKGKERYGKVIKIPKKMKLEGTGSVVFFPKGQSTGGLLELSSGVKNKKKKGYVVEIDKITGEARVTRLQSY